MKKGLLISIALILAASAVALAIGYPFQPVYTFIGSVKAGDGGQPPDGEWAIVTKSLAEYQSGIYGYDIIGATGASKLANYYCANAFNSTFLMSLKAGDKVLVATVKDASGYGAGPVEVTLTGQGYEGVPEMTKTLGGGIDPPPPPAILGAPLFKEIWFGNRLYQPVLVAKGEKFIISPTPLIKARLEAQGDSGIKQESVTIAVDEGQAGSKMFGLTQFSTGMQVRTVGALVASLNVEYQMKSDERLAEGDHTFTFRATDTSGAYSTSETVVGTIMGGPAQVIGPVIFYPSPFSPTKHVQAEIQYTLSVDAEVELFIYSMAGELVKKLYGKKGQEGGSAGINKVKWDGKNSYGNMLGNGIYNSTIYDTAQGKTLAKFKATIYE